MMLGLSPLRWREVPLWRLLRTRLLEAHKRVRLGDLWDFDRVHYLALHKDRLQDEVVGGRCIPTFWLMLSVLVCLRGSLKNGNAQGQYKNCHHNKEKEQY